MSNFVREQLLGHLLGALDESERNSVEARLEHDREYRGELAKALRLLEPLESAREGFPPPPRLAERTCRFVFAHLDRPVAAASKRRAMSPEPAPPSWICRVGWLDMAMAASVLAVAALLIIPAIGHSRFNARLMACQDNLRQLYQALTQYSEHNQECFPTVPAEGKLAAAGIYAPVLLRDGYLTEANRVICPDSPLADQREFQVPSVDEIQTTAGDRLAELRRRMGGSYGYCLGHMRDGRYQPTRNLHRENFALMSDAPSRSRMSLQTDNHGGRGQNVLFEDGHVRFLPSPKPRGFTDDFFHNDDGYVAAGLHRDDSVIGSSASPPIIYVNR